MVWDTSVLAALAATARVAARAVRYAVVGLLVAGAGTGSAQSEWRSVFSETFGDDAHPLYVMAGVIAFGQQPDTPFVASLGEGGLVLENAVDPSVLRFYFVEPRHSGPWQDAAGAPVAAAVTVGGQFGEAPGAGLIYRVEPATFRFYSFVLTGGQGYGIFVLDEQGYRPLVTGESPHVAAAGTNRIIVLPDRTDLHMVVNGELVASLDTAGRQGGPAGTGIGLLVGGTGRWVFDDFEVYVQ